MVAHSFIQYWRALSPKEKTVFAKGVEVAKVYLSKIAGGHSKPSDRLVRRMVEYDPRVKQVWFL